MPGIKGMSSNPYTKEEKAFIKENARTIPVVKIAEKVGRTTRAIYSYLKRHNIKTGRSGQFVKGGSPWNQGRTGISVSPGSEFKKGTMPTNTKPDGYITTRSDKDYKSGVVRRYKYIRVSNAKWILYHRYLWAKEKGPIPKGHLVRFKDGDTQNCTLENLECISMAENARRNHNREKARKSMLTRYEDGDINNPLQRMHDSAIAAWIAPRDREMQKELLNHPELIELKRIQIKLQRQINATN